MLNGRGFVRSTTMFDLDWRRVQHLRLNAITENDCCRPHVYSFLSTSQGPAFEVVYIRPGFLKILDYNRDRARGYARRIAIFPRPTERFTSLLIIIRKTHGILAHRFIIKRRVMDELRRVNGGWGGEKGGYCLFFVIFNFSLFFCLHQTVF